MTDVALELKGLSDEAREQRVKEIMKRMEAWGVSSLVSSLDFFEGGILTREEALSVCGVSEGIFSKELAERRKERRQAQRKYTPTL